MKFIIVALFKALIPKDDSILVISFNGKVFIKLNLINPINVVVWF